MTGQNLTFTGKTLSVASKEFQVEYPIRDAFALEDKVIVLYDPNARVEKFGQFPNLVAFTPQGKKLWTAELPTTMSSDCYYEIVSGNPLTAYSFNSYECRIDSSTGKILKKEFLK